MKVSITKRHIRTGRLESERRTPLELAVLELDCFEDMRLIGGEDLPYWLEIDGSRVSLPANAQAALEEFAVSGEMKPFSFELPLEQEAVFAADDLLYGFGMEEDFSGGWDYA